MAYIAYQASIENLRDLGASSIITDLTNTPREQNGVEMAATISDMFVNKSPPEWENVTMGIGELHECNLTHSVEEKKLYFVSRSAQLLHDLCWHRVLDHDAGL